jgi:hypothetical protein
MASPNKIIRGGPLALTPTTTANLFNPGTTTGGVNMPATSTNLYFVLRHIRIVNTTTSAIQVALWLGATGTNAVGKEFAYGGIASGGALTDGVSIPGSGAGNVNYVDWYGATRMDAADFLVGGASAAGLTITIDAEMGVN